LTGFPGWLGDNVVGDFFAGRWPDYSALRCLAAPWTDEAALASARARHPGLEIARADLLDQGALNEALRDCHGVLHSAGIIHVRHPSDWYRTNFRGTANLLQAAKRAGTVERIVYVSSNAAGGRAPRGELMRESAPSVPLSTYGRSKKLAEDTLLDGRGGIDIVILRPCMFYGTPVPARHVEFFKRVRSGLVPVIGADLPRSMIHVRNLAQACRLAFSSKAAAQRIFYLADAQPYSIDQYVRTIAGSLGVSPKLLPLPSILASLAYRIDRLLEATGRYNQTVHLLGEANWSVGVSIDEAKDKLGYDPRLGLADGIKEAVEWCRERGLLT
jgi:nucleoside-diphosphate-sugar epimerase